MKEKNVKKDKTKIKKNNDNKKSIKLDKKKFVIFSCILVFIIVILIIVLSVVFNKKDKEIDKEYLQLDFNERMDTFGLSKMYNDDEKVSRIEVLKISTLAAKEKRDLNDMFFTDDLSDENWIRDITGSINKVKNYINVENKDENITNQDTIEMVYYIFKNYLKGNVESKHEPDEIIEYMKQEKIIENDINLEENTTKDEFNKIIIRCMYIFNSFDRDSTSNSNVVVDTDKLPSNSQMYPYILSNVSKNVYEYGFKNSESQDFISPKDLYKDVKGDYEEIENNITKYFNAILNVNYEKFDVDNFGKIIERTSNYNDYYYQLFKKRVENNKLVVSGKSQVILPCIYKVGDKYYVRTYVEFKITNAESKSNLMFWNTDSLKFDISSFEYVDKYVDEYDTNTQYKFYVDLELDNNFKINRNNINLSKIE